MKRNGRRGWKDLYHVRESSTTGNKIMVLLTDWDDSSLVIDKLCDDAVKGDTAIRVLGMDELVWGRDLMDYGSWSGKEKNNNLIFMFLLRV